MARVPTPGRDWFSAGPAAKLLGVAPSQGDVFAPSLAKFARKGLCDLLFANARSIKAPVRLGAANQQGCFAGRQLHGRGACSKSGRGPDGLLTALRRPAENLFPPGKGRRKRSIHGFGEPLQCQHNDFHR